MQAKNVLYAAVGAPVVAARKVNDVVGDLRTRINKETAEYTKVAGKAIDSWASEGEKVVTRVTDNKTVEELTAKVDLDQAKEQVGKLRTQLEDMLGTWRTSFRPEKAEATGSGAKATVAPKPAAKPVAKKPAAKKPAAKPVAKKPAAKKPAAKATASRASAAKTTKSTTAKTSSAKAPAAKAAKAS